MRMRLAATAAVIVLGAGAAVAADAPATMTPPAAAASVPHGYLAAGAVDTLRILPEAPVPGTPRYEADRKIFLASRSMKDSPRWALATADVDETRTLQDFSCAAGVVLSPQTSPKVVELLTRMSFDVRPAIDIPKNFYKRQRPFLVDKGDTCIEQSAALAASPDYPSGHTTWGWSVGLVLAEAEPDRATDILVRARSFGESRMVCGVHNLSAVDGGRTNASAVVAALHGSAAFRADMDGVRAELADLRAHGAKPDPAACATEASLIAKSPY